MLRQLLTLLALLTGLAATGEIAQARVVGVENVALAVQAENATAARAQAIVALAEMPDARIAAPVAALPQSAEIPLPPAPVLVPADRARE